MEVFHLGNAAYARQLTGEGARLFGGRWNQKGDACLYASATRALCILEYLANVDPELMPLDLSITVYAVPEEGCYYVPQKELPAEWNDVPVATATRLFGSDLLRQKKHLCFAMPSVIVPQEKNFILNPAADGFTRIKIASVEPFRFDNRLKSLR